MEKGRYKKSFNEFIITYIYFHSTLLDSKMSRSFTLTLNGNEPITKISYFPPIELTNGEYERALIDFHMYNSIPNVDLNSNLK